MKPLNFTSVKKVLCPLKVEVKTESAPLLPPDYRGENGPSPKCLPINKHHWLAPNSANIDIQIM